jgi:hypothetical protein
MGGKTLISGLATKDPCLLYRESATRLDLRTMNLHLRINYGYPLHAIALSKMILKRIRGSLVTPYRYLYSMASY